MNGPARHEYFKIAGLHNSCFSAECNFDPTFDHAKILLVVLRVFMYIQQHKRRACRAATFVVRSGMKGLHAKAGVCSKGCIQSIFLQLVGYTAFIVATVGHLIQANGITKLQPN